MPKWKREGGFLHMAGPEKEKKKERGEEAWLLGAGLAHGYG